MRSFYLNQNIILKEKRALFFEEKKSFLSSTNDFFVSFLPGPIFSYFRSHLLLIFNVLSAPGTTCYKEPALSQLEEEDERRFSIATERSDNLYSSTCSLPRRISSSIGYSPVPGYHFDPITELSCEEDGCQRKRREKQRSVSCS